MNFTTPPPDLEELRALWAWLRPPGCRLTLAEALRHSTYSIVLKCAARRGRKKQRREKMHISAAGRPAEPDLFAET